MSSGLPQIPCTEIVARAVDPDQLTNSVPRTVRKAAFIPRKNGKDNAGLSATVVRPGVLGFLRERLASPAKEAITLHVGRVREVSVNGHSLDVTPDPVERRLAARLDCGIPEASCHLHRVAPRKGSVEPTGGAARPASSMLPETLDAVADPHAPNRTLRKLAAALNVSPDHPA